jgi:hypothetical protein
VTTVTVDHGAVAVLDNHARTIRVEAGQSLRVGPEGTTSGPTPVSPSAATAPNPQPAAPRPTAPSRRSAPVPGAVESPPSEAAPAPRDYRLKVIEIDVPPQQGPRPGGG